MASFSGGGNDFPPLICPTRNRANDEGFWVSMETVHHEKSATQLPILMVKKFMEQAFPGTRTAKPTREGKLIIQARNKQIGLQAMKYKRLYDVCDIVFTPMKSMNHRLGSVYGREMLTISEKDLEAELKSQHVIKVERAQTMKDGILSPNGLHILTFDTTKLPEEIYVGYMRYGVRLYYPRPLRCSRCCVFGHTKKRCSEEDEACRNCKEKAHHGTPCTGKYCRNCKVSEKHGTFDKECPMFELEVAIVRLKVDNNWSYGQARAALNKEINKSAESYKNSISETISKAARERAMESESIKVALTQNNLEIEKLKEEIQALKESSETFIKLRNEQKKLLQFNQNIATSSKTQIQKKTPTSQNAHPKNANPHQTRSKTSEKMNTETNLKRKNTGSDNAPLKRTALLLTMDNLKDLMGSQLTNLKQKVNSITEEEPIIFEMDDNNTIRGRHCRNRDEIDTAIDVIQWVNDNLEDTEDIDLTI
jgi:hypothetical protein